MTEDQALRIECARLAVQAVTSTGGKSTDVAPAARELYEWIGEATNEAASP